VEPGGDLIVAAEGSIQRIGRIEAAIDLGGMEPEAREIRIIEEFPAIEVEYRPIICGTAMGLPRSAYIQGKLIYGLSQGKPTNPIANVGGAVPPSGLAELSEEDHMGRMTMPLAKARGHPGFRETPQKGDIFMVLFTKAWKVRAMGIVSRVAEVPVAESNEALRECFLDAKRMGRFLSAFQRPPENNAGGYAGNPADMFCGTIGVSGEDGKLELIAKGGAILRYGARKTWIQCGTLIGSVEDHDSFMQALEGLSQSARRRGIVDMIEAGSLSRKIRKGSLLMAFIEGLPSPMGIITSFVPVRQGLMAQNFDGLIVTSSEAGQRKLLSSKGLLVEPRASDSTWAAEIGRSHLTRRKDGQPVPWLENGGELVAKNRFGADVALGRIEKHIPFDKLTMDQKVKAQKDILGFVRDRKKPALARVPPRRFNM
jgi:hypothetical protein